ncbi:class I SAM-dependent methyltransferase [Agrobacterium tumefaciens]|uniref:class I SAM-dependent methyltransferase n=1 Tax=Agrobacterium tumefaciens TaxID=358 RepID=UPI0021F94BE9|nr:class I SAM-dependent methyltransferase [Agrobacterium tumefaciens]
MQCNICGSGSFIAMNKRPNVRCSGCGSVERTRVIKMMLDQLGLPKPGMRVLHLAPEEGLANYLRGIVGADNYDARDIDLERYKKIKVTYFDLVKDVDKLPSKAFDLIIHSHVMEHLPCNVTAVLFHLHRALTDNGAHVCSIPICDGYYEESTFPLPDAERERRFGQFDHVRRFGTEDLHLTLGMLFKIPKTYDLTTTFSEADLNSANIPATTWRGYSPHSVLALKKGDLLLNSDLSAQPMWAPRQSTVRFEDVRPASRTFRNFKRFIRKQLYQLNHGSMPSVTPAARTARNFARFLKKRLYRAT